MREAERVPAQEPARLSETADRRLRAARLWITLNRPYYSPGVVRVPADPHPTGGDDGHRRQVAAST